MSDNRKAMQSDAKRNPHYKENKIIIVECATSSQIKTTCYRAESAAAFLQSAFCVQNKAPKLLGAELPTAQFITCVQPCVMAAINNGKLLKLLLLLYIWLAVFPHHTFFYCDVAQQALLGLSAIYTCLSVWTANYWSTRILFHIFFNTPQSLPRA